ncbi:hypothetical protein ACE01N_15950 [Saccharicrinis sp. FJH2]|uniref:hypothetical protein n=1 Tax=Saccharicrinis sp. FJH65 TaxID=3344659 RepID=UPI0035F27DAF
MKRLFLPLFVLTWVLVLSGIILFQTKESDSEVMEIVFIVVLVAFFFSGIVLSYGRIKGKKDGYTPEDELARKIAHKVAAISYFTSLIFWLGMVILHHYVEISTKNLLASGLIGMALIFLILWIVFTVRGLPDEDQSS